MCMGCLFTAYKKIPPPIDQEKKFTIFGMRKIPQYHIGLTIDRWGPAAWNTLHVVAHAFPRSPTNEQRLQTAQFLHLFAEHLPCPACREHFKEYLAKHLNDNALQNRTSMIEFMHDAHNDVNHRLGKRIWTLDEHFQVYRRRSIPTTSSQATTCAMVLVVLVLIVVLVGRQRHRKIFAR